MDTKGTCGHQETKSDRNSGRDTGSGFRVQGRATYNMPKHIGAYYIVKCKKRAYLEKKSISPNKKSNLQTKRAY